MTPQQPFTSEDGKTIYYWPYCSTCHQPYDFDDEGPFAYCECGTSEWGYPRPAEWIGHPRRANTGPGWHLETIHRLDRPEPVAVILFLRDGTRKMVEFSDTTA
jgi:hypothetical protein